MTEKEFKRLLTLYLDGDLSTEEIVRFKDAVEESPTYRHQFQDEIRLHTQLHEVVSEKIEEKKITKPAKRKPIKKFKSQPKPIFAYILSAVATLTITGVLLGFYLSQNQGTVVGVCVQTPNEGVHEVIRNDKAFSLHKDMKLYKNDIVVSRGASGTLLSLNDGSMVSLEDNTQITLQNKAESHISIFQGEILLEVNSRKEGQTPFKVKTPDSIVTVLGTVFSVNAIDDGFTRLKVYEGKVNLYRSSDSKEVDVIENQSVITSDLDLSTVALGSQQEEVKDEVINLLPSDDAYIDGKRTINDSLIKVRKGSRTMYLKFKVQDVGQIKKAVLFLKQEIDPGSGTLFFHLADSNSWTEKSLKFKNAPRPKELIARRTGAISGGQKIAVDLSKGIKKDGVYTIIVTLSRGDAHDIWFSSKEGPNPPVLQLTK